MRPDSGSPITSYTITPLIGATKQTPVTVSGTPLPTSATVSGLTNGTAYTFVVTATNAIGTGPTSAASPVISPTAQGVTACPCSLLASSATPPTSDSGDASPISVGLRFTAETDGYLTGLRYYRDAANTGVHTGTLYSAAGAVLATLTFGTGDPGWQYASFATAVPVTAGTTYVASTFMPNGHYSYAPGFFTAPVVNSPLTGTLGTYIYGADAFPTSSWNDGYYYVDVVYSAQDPGPPATTTAPGAPTGVSAVANDGSATVSWSPPDSGSPITSYTITPLIGATKQTPVTVSGTPLPTSATVSGLTNGTAYTFVVTATNAIGTGPTSAASPVISPAAPVTSPSAPTGVSAAAGNSAATVSWTVPATDGGSPISSYSVIPYIGTAAQAATVVPAPATSAVVNGLRNGTVYTFVVTATNAVGTSTGSGASSAVTPASVPDAPTAVAAAAGNGSATVSWSAPASNGGSAVTSYVVMPFIGTVAQPATTISGTPPATAGTVTGLTNGQAYMFTVTAVNAIGSSAPSAPSTAVTPTGVPGAPTGVVGVRGDGAVSVSWTAPVSNGGSAIAGYTVTPFIGTVAQPVTTVTGAPPAASVTVSGLTNGTAYTFRVAATNALGTGALSTASAAVTPARAPDAPTGVSAVAGSGSATVSWTAPANGGSVITRYTVTPFIGTVAQPVRTITGAPPAASLVVTGLTNGTAYTFTVMATNAVGNGAVSAPSAAVTPTGVPGAPTGVVGVRGDGAVSVSWTAPVSNGGSAIAGYTVTPFIGTVAQPVTTVTGAPPAASVTVSGLTNGTAYTFRVAATNALGTGALSTASAAVTPARAPDAPTGVSAVAGSGSATVSWTSPANGGSVITRYTVTPFIGTVAQPVRTITGAPPAASLVVTGLTNGTAYTFTVMATNAVGNGAVSAPSTALTPFVPTFVQQVIGRSAAASAISVTPTNPITVGNRLVVMVGVRNSTGPTAQSVTDSAGNSYIRLEQFTASDLTEMSIWTAPITRAVGHVRSSRQRRGQRRPRHPGAGVRRPLRGCGCQCC